MSFPPSLSTVSVLSGFEVSAFEASAVAFVLSVVGVYHFWHYGTNEAQYFLDKVKKMGLDRSTWLALDVEAPDLPQKGLALNG